MSMLTSVNFKVKQIKTMQRSTQYFAFLLVIVDKVLRKDPLKEGEEVTWKKKKRFENRLKYCILCITLKKDN